MILILNYIFKIIFSYEIIFKKLFSKYIDIDKLHKIKFSFSFV